MDKKINVYTTPTCTYCNMLKNFLDEKNIAYNNIDVSENQEKASYIAEKTEQLGVPVLEIIPEEGETQYIVGFDEEGISKELGL